MPAILISDQAAKLKQLEKLEREELKALEAEAVYKKSHMCEYFRPWSWQEKALDLVRKFNITIVPAPNDIGKTSLEVNIVNSWCEGYEPWTKSQEQKPGYERFGKYWYRPSSLGTKPPVRIRMTGEDWTHHIGEVINPEFEKWAIEGKYKMSRNSNPSVTYLYTHTNGSTVELMTYSQKIEVFESWKGHGWVPDEPPPPDIFESMSRGLVGRGGKILIFMTPL
jgi:hypothetical protein